MTDDALVLGINQKEHDEKLIASLEKILRTRLTRNRNVSFIIKSRRTFLWQIMMGWEFTHNPEMISTIMNFATTRNISDVWRFLVMCNQLSKFFLNWTEKKKLNRWETYFVKIMHECWNNPSMNQSMNWRSCCPAPQCWHYMTWTLGQLFQPNQMLPVTDLKLYYFGSKGMKPYNQSATFPARQSFGMFKMSSYGQTTVPKSLLIHMCRLLSFSLNNCVGVATIVTPNLDY